MNQTFGIVLPVFGLIGVGYAVAWTELLRRDTAEVLAEFVFYVAVPVLVFRTIVAADLGGMGPWRLWIAYFGGFTVVWIAGHAVARGLFGRDHRGGLVSGIASAYSNNVLLGIPLVLAAFGEQGAVVTTLIVAVNLPLALFVSTILIARAKRLDGVATESPNFASLLASVGRDLVTTPVIIGIAGGALWRLTDIPIGGLPGELVARIGDIAGTLALIALGMSLGKYGMRRNIPAGLALSALKLVAAPALVLLLGRYVVGLPPVWVKAAVLTAACPTGVAAYLVASSFRTGEALASNAIAISTTLAVFTTAAWLHVLAWI